ETTTWDSSARRGGRAACPARSSTGGSTATPQAASGPSRLRTGGSSASRRTACSAPCRRVVGVAAHSLFRAVLEGEERVVSFSVHATTHVSARGQGIFAALQAKHEREATERGVAVVL